MFVCRISHLFAHKTECIANPILQQKNGIKTFASNYGSIGNESAESVPRRRVVVTGCGVISPIGCDTATAWNSILNCSCGIRMLDSKYESLPCKIAAKISEEDLNLAAHFSRSELRSLAKTTVYALMAGKFKN